MKSLILSFSLLWSLGNAQSIADYLKVPLVFDFYLTNGYDNNVLRLSSREQDRTALESELLGKMTTFDSHYMRGNVRTEAVIHLSGSKRITAIGGVTFTRYSHSPDKRYFSGHATLKFRWGLYRWIRYSIRDLNNFYLRDYINRDVSEELLLSCFFTDRDQKLTVSQPLDKRIWITATGGFLQRYYTARFTEFDLDISYLRGRISVKMPEVGSISAEGEAGKADNITFGKTARSSNLDRSYSYFQYYVPVKISRPFAWIDEWGLAVREEFRMYSVEDVFDPLHSGRAHRDSKLDLWVQKNIGDSVWLKANLRLRNRETESEYEWVKSLKSFKQVQAWIQFGWEMVYDNY